MKEKQVIEGAEQKEGNIAGPGHWERGKKSPR